MVNEDIVSLDKDFRYIFGRVRSIWFTLNKIPLLAENLDKGNSNCLRYRLHFTYARRHYICH